MTGIKIFYLFLFILLAGISCTTHRVSVKYGDSIQLESVEITMNKNETGRLSVLLQNTGADSTRIMINPWMELFTETGRVIKTYKTVTVCEGDVCSIKKVPVYNTKRSSIWDDFTPGSENLVLSSGSSVTRMYQAPSDSLNSAFVEFVIENQGRVDSVVVRVF